MTKQDPNRLYQRAVAALYRTPLGIPQQPTQALSTVEQHQGKHFVVLRNAQGIVACYRVNTNGRLMRVPSESVEVAL